LNCLIKGDSYFVYNSDDTDYLILDDKVNFKLFSKKHFRPISKP